VKETHNFFAFFERFIRFEKINFMGKEKPLQVVNFFIMKYCSRY